MKVSLNWVKKFTSVDLPVNELVEKIGAQLGAVEEVINLGELYRGIYAVKVVECAKHPNADKLSVCLIDDGGKVKGVKRNKQGLVEVVCGAPNARAGQTVAWIPPGATVPSTLDKDPLVLEARELRGVISNGMLASGKELAIGDSHEGLLIIDEDVKPGTPFAKVYGLDDYIIDIENKMFTHRPDCFGMLGVARELAGIQQQKFVSPNWYQADTKLQLDGRKQSLKLEIKNQAGKLVPRFCAIAIADVRVQPSPVWLQSYLARVGVRPINNIVDLTNYIMLETGQPLHAYDYNKLKTGVLGTRLSRKGETLKIIGGKQIKLDAGAVVITDGNQPIGLGGVMGGADTEVSADTKNIVLECANFEMNQVRKTSMHYGLFTDAATRFTKGQSPLQNVAVLARAVECLQEIAGGRPASKLLDDHAKLNTPTPVKVSVDFINQRLGSDLKKPEVIKLLRNVEFIVTDRATELSIVAPFWRTDIDTAEDVVEEVGRLSGYDKLPETLPQRDLEPAQVDPLLRFKSRLRDILAEAGGNELLTYSFVPGRLLENAGQDPKLAYHIKNALSPALQYYRLSLTPSLLDKVHPNVKAGFDKFALFEIGKGHVKGMLDEEKLPKELERLSLVVASKDPKPGAPYYAVKELCDHLLHELGIRSATYEPLDSSKKYGTVPYYEPLRGANIKAGERIIGRIGEFKQSVVTAFKLPNYCAGFDLHTDELLELALPNSYYPLNRFPEIEQDICLRSVSSLSYAELNSFVRSELDKMSKTHDYHYQLKALDIFQKPQDKAHKQTTWRIELNHPERTLTSAEANKVLDQIAAAAKTKLKAERI